MDDRVTQSGPRLGHLNLNVADVDRAVEFYCRLGFRVVRRAPGAPIAFLGLEQAGAFQLGLGLAEEPAVPRSGLDHFALAYPSPAELARACQTLIDEGAEVVAAHEYGVSKSVYFTDPDGNGVELYWEYPPEGWPPEDERFRMRPLDLDALLATADTGRVVTKADGEARTSGGEMNTSASQQIDEKITELADWRGETLSRMRELIKEADPEVVEEWKWAKPTSPGTPVWSHDGGICTGETYKSVVKLTFFKGASLDDPGELFNSSLEGNVRRAIDIHEGEEVDEAAFKALIRDAVALNTSGRKAGQAK